MRYRFRTLADMLLDSPFEAQMCRAYAAPCIGISRLCDRKIFVKSQSLHRASGYERRSPYHFPQIPRHPLVDRTVTRAAQTTT